MYIYIYAYTYIHVYIYIYICIIYIYIIEAVLVLGRGIRSMRHRSAPKEKCPWCLSLWGPLGDTPPIRNDLFMSPYQAPEGTNTKVTSAKGRFCAYPDTLHGL